MSRQVVSKEISKPVSVKRFQDDQEAPESSIAAFLPSRN
jgi:predicted alpha/beta hydrolase